MHRDAPERIRSAVKPTQKTFLNRIALRTGGTLLSVGPLSVSHQSVVTDIELASSANGGLGHSAKSLGADVHVANVAQTCGTPEDLHL